mgnify:CR=1 FL=1
MYCNDIKMLADVIDDLRRRGRTIAICPGCFDVLHPGHVYLLSRAKLAADFVLVAMNTDASVRRAKGPDRPFMQMRDRGTMLTAIKYVDAVVTYEQDTPEELCKIVRPDVMVKGSQYEGEYLPGEEYCTEKLFVDMVSDLSTTGIMARLNGTHSR